jgi:hypothetical protein
VASDKHRSENPRATIAAIIGAALGVLPIPVCWQLSAMGHGTRWPPFAFYGPAALAVYYLGDLLPASVDGCIVLLPPGLYAGYSVILSRARAKGNPSLAFALILIIHCLAAAIGIMTGDDSMADFQRTADECWKTTIFGTILFIALYATAVVYTFRGTPGLWQFSLRSLLLLVAVAAIICSLLVWRFGPIP